MFCRATIAEEAEAAVAKEGPEDSVNKITRKLRRDHNTNQDIPVKHLMEQTSLKKGQINLDKWKEQAIKKLKNGKAPGADGVCPEMLKAEEQVTPEILREIFQSIYMGK